MGMDLQHAYLTELRECLLNDAGGLPLRPHPKPPVPDPLFQHIRISTGLELLQFDRRTQSIEHERRLSKPCATGRFSPPIHAHTAHQPRPNHRCSVLG